MQEQQDKIEADRKKLEDEKAEAEKQKKQRLFSERTNALAELGFTLSTAAAIATKTFTRAGNVTVSLSTIAEITDDQFAELVQDAKDKIAAKETENETLEADYKKQLQDEADKKAAEQLKQKQEAEEQQRKEAEAEKQRLAELAPDKEKFKILAENMRGFIDRHNKLEFKTAASKKAHGETIVLLEKTYTFVLDKINGLR